MSRARAVRRARGSFWILFVVAVAATGSLSAALMAPPGAWTGIRVALSGLVLILAGGLAARVMIALERARRQKAAAGGDRRP